MLDQNTFTETIRAVQDIIRTSAEPMTREEILSYFKDMDLNAQQEEMVLEFLSTPHDDPQPEENEPETKEAEYEETAEKEEPKDSSAKKESAKDSVTDNISTSPMFQMYLEELKDIPEYTKEQQIDMYKKLLAGEESMVHALSNAWLRNVLEVAKKLAVSPEGFEDIVQEGNMALFLRLSELCGSHEKVDVEEELLTAVEEAMKSCIREQTGEDENENSVVGKVALVSEAVNYLKKQNGAQPTQKELADYVKIPEDELADILYMTRVQKERFSDLMEYERVKKALNEATEQLKEKTQAIVQAEQHIHALGQQTKAASHILRSNYDSVIKAALYDNLIGDFQQKAPLLNDDKAVFDNTVLQDFSEDGKNLFTCTLLLMTDMMDKATDFAQTHGGGGNTSKLPWRGRDKDEDDITWARRCAMHARSMMKPASGAKRKR